MLLYPCSRRARPGAWVLFLAASPSLLRAPPPTPLPGAHTLQLQQTCTAEEALERALFTPWVFPLGHKQVTQKQPVL